MSKIEFLPPPPSPQKLSQTPVVSRKRSETRSAPRAPSPDQAPASAAEDQLLFNTIPELAVPNIDQRVLAAILKKLGVDFFQSALAGETETIKFDQTRLQTLAKENQKKLADMLKKVEKQKKAGILGKIFGWIAAAIGTILGSVFAVVSFGSGAALAGTLIAASVTLAVSLVIASSTGGMEKLVDALAKAFAGAFEAFGMDHKKAMRVSKIMSEALIAIAVIAVQIILAVASGGASVANFANELANKIASFTVKAVNITMALVAAAGAGASTASGVFNFQMLRDQADMTENKAFLRKMHTLIEAQQDMIQEIINDLMGTQGNMNKLIKDENENRGILADIDAQPSAV